MPSKDDSFASTRAIIQIAAGAAKNYNFCGDRRDRLETAVGTIVFHVGTVGTEQ